MFRNSEFDEPEEEKPIKPNLESEDLKNERMEIPAEKHLSETSESKNWSIGRPAELAGLEKAQNETGQVMDLNDLTGNANNFPIYDIYDGDKLVSIKHYGYFSEGEQLSDSTLSSYRNAFCETIGNGTDPNKYDKCESMLREKGNISLDQGVSSQQTFQNSELWVPKDHAEQIKSDWSERLSLGQPVENLSEEQKINRDVYASHLGLDAESPNFEEDAHNRLNQVKPLDYTSGELKTMYDEGKFIPNETSPGKTKEAEINPENQIQDVPHEWVDRGIIDVNLDELPDPEGVSLENFDHHINWEDAQRVTQQLPEVQKAVNEGNTREYFEALDQKNGVDPSVGTQRIYDLYYGGDAVKIDRDGEQIDIVNGRHRIFAAKKMGLQSIPAHVVERRRK